MRSSGVVDAYVGLRGQECNADIYDTVSDLLDDKRNVVDGDISMKLWKLIFLSSA